MSQPSNEARILLALQALQNNPKLRLRRAATIYKVRYSTLRDRRNGIQSRSDWVPKSRKLSDLEEQIIVQFLLDLDSRGFPARLRFVEEIANSLLADRDASPVGKRWAHNFVKRQPELKTRLFRRYDYQRAKCEDPTIIRGWFRLVQNTIAKYGIRSDDIWNFDETGFMMGLIMAGMAVTGSERRGRPKSVQPGNREWITVIQAINAEGQSIAPFIIGAGQYHLANWYRESNLPADWVIATSQNGWTNNELGLEWLKHFDRSTTKRSNARYRLLILDGHESHHSTDFEKYCKENKIITLCMPAHASHLLQPLDIGCFAVLKKAYGQEIEHLIRCSITHISKTEFFPAFYAAFKATFTESNIRGGFRGAGLAPLDPETVISKLDVQLRTPTPPEEVSQPSTPWVSKTPKTATEAQSQSEYLERRIRRHKSSSPESIIEALKSNTKATRAIMHEVVLLRNEVRNLRDANEILSRRRRAKRTRLQKGGAMTVQEASQVIDQMDVDAQVVAESSRNGARGRSDRPGGRRCGVCGKAGHNARTCQVVIETSREEYSK
ncbi:transposase [Fusarium oxysporum f. sp. phaseoli]